MSVGARRASNLIRHARDVLLESSPKQIALSGPSGFIGRRVLDSILEVHAERQRHGLEPGEVVLLSSSPGRLMGNLTKKYGSDKMRTVRASRVDYYNQHTTDMWHDQLGSLGMGGKDAVFVNLAGVAGPIPDKPTAMQDVNYTAPMAAAKAAMELDFGHWIQSSTQATKAERAGQVPYSRWKAMMDYTLSRMDNLPVTILTMGLIYCKDHKVVGQRSDKLNMVDLALLPVTPIMGNGGAPLQPLEVQDAAERVAFLALSEPSHRPLQSNDSSWAASHWIQKASIGKEPTAMPRLPKISAQRSFTLRMYDAVGPETMSIMELLDSVAKIHGKHLRPVHVDYRNYERILNVASLGNLNRQFISLLRSEQASNQPIVGNSSVFARLLGDQARLVNFEEAMRCQASETKKRKFPISTAINWVIENPGVVLPGLSLMAEAALVLARQKGSFNRWPFNRTQQDADHPHHPSQSSQHSASSSASSASAPSSAVIRADDQMMPHEVQSHEIQSHEVHSQVPVRITTQH
eukprot:CAMPEP_0197852368 /NCGR_PEP_ID=MMETSP1438-20131217/20399_1 /TAXON_ID=1461541 /ORGANISM="Pterosperma sp., Strain CCMP1384" /LENGTH=519 /DNA_ID=CAMNT_0043466383 /DNA_START=259 /DNA_END=1815 /DNA_ORIENTATION=+